MSDAKEQILQATLELINEIGIEKVTTREIANRARVNSASLHYYFGTKERLVSVALEHFTGRMLEALEALQLDNMRPRQQLIAFITAFVGQAISYPGIIKSLLCGSMDSGKVPVELVSAIGRGQTTLGEMIRNMLPEENAETVTFLTLQLISGAMYPILVRVPLVAVAQLDYFLPVVRERYLSHLVQALFGEEKE